MFNSILMHKGRVINKEYKQSEFENQINAGSSDRLDLNVLLERLKNETNMERKKGYLIIGAITSIAVVMAILFYI